MRLLRIKQTWRLGRSWRVLILIAATLIVTGMALCQATAQRHALLIAGIGGSSDYQAKFQKYLFETRRALIDRFQFDPQRIVVLAGTVAEDAGFIDGRSDAETIKRHFAELSQSVSSDADLYVILFGHGSFDGKNAVLNIPRRDLKDVDYAGLIRNLSPRRLVFVNTASCSGPFVDHLSGPGRIVITATKSGGERNETVFPQFLIEAFASPDSDLDKNGELSVLEAFLSASGRVDRYFAENNHLATEHAILEDTGDKAGFRAEAILDKGEGGLAGITYLAEKTPILAIGAVAAADSLITGLNSQKLALESQILTIRMEKANLAEADYLAQLEPLFIRLATINNQLDAYSDTQNGSEIK